MYNDPQVTVLSPILNIIYASSLSKLNKEGNLYSYTDDTSLIISWRYMGLRNSKSRAFFKKVME